MIGRLAAVPLPPMLPAFSLRNSLEQDVSFPSGRTTLLCFVKEDCPTCQVVMPVLEALYRQLDGHVDVLVAGQTKDGNLKLIEKHQLTVPILDDSTLKVSFAYDLDIVPTLVLADGNGRQIRRIEGFAQADWVPLVDEIAAITATDAATIDWASLPEWRPGCGSLSVDPIISERLRAESENSPLRARKIEIAPSDDVIEFMFDQGMTDGLPVVPPTPERVLRMLSGTQRDPQEVIALMPPNMGPVTVEKLAINAVMAGCKPEYMPVVIAAVQAACTDEFNIHGVMATTMGASPVMIVNGPIRHRLGMNMGLGALGQGNRANLAIGRALRLAIRNLGGAKPGGTERSTMGNPMKITMCFPEWEERNPWSPYHVDRGFAPGDSVVTLFAATSGPSLIVDQTSRTASQLAGSLGLNLESAHHVRSHRGTDVVLVVCPEHIDTLVRDGYTKADLKRRIQEVTSRPVRELVQDEVSGVGFSQEQFARMTEAQKDALVPKFNSEDDIHVVVAGADAGKFSAAFHGWARGAIGSIPVSRKIEEV